MSKKRRFALKKLQVSDLREHPNNEKIFSPLAEPELQLLAEDMDANGLGTPIDVTPDGVIVGGHMRVRAAKLLGWSTIECRVHEDWQDPHAPEVIEHLISDNLNRRQCTRLGVARACDALFTTMKRRDINRDNNELREIIGKRLGTCGRTVSRYQRLLTLPRALQDAIDSGNLPMALGSKIAGLNRAEREKIAERVAMGESVRRVADEYVPKSSKRSASFESDIAPVGSAIERVADAVKELQQWWLTSDQIDDEDRSELNRVAGDLNELLRPVPKVRRRSPNSLAG